MKFEGKTLFASLRVQSSTEGHPAETVSVGGKDFQVWKNDAEIWNVTVDGKNQTVGPQDVIDQYVEYINGSVGKLTLEDFLSGDSQLRGALVVGVLQKKVTPLLLQEAP